MKRADKQAHMEHVASQAEEAANRRGQGQMYKITKLINGKYCGANDMLIVNKQGRHHKNRAGGKMGRAF